MLDFFVTKISLFFDFDQNNVFEVLLVLMAIVWTSGKVFRYFQLPLMLGELLAGIIVGPAVLDLVHDNEVIKVFAELGIFFMLLHSGLESNPSRLLKNSKFALLLALTGIVTSFGVGYYVCRLMQYSFETSLFIGMTLSFTSIAIVHTTVKSLKIQSSKTGHILQSSALITELIAFLLFSLILNLLKQNSFNLLDLSWIFTKVILFFLFSIGIGFKILPKINRCFNTKGKKGFTFSLVVALFFGLIAEKIGLHVILGAYLAGIFIRQNIESHSLYNKIEDRIFGLSYSFLGPIFFASIGLHISFEILYSKEIYVFLIILLTAIGCKLVPTLILCNFHPKLSLRESAAIGSGLIARGEMTLILANIGFVEISQSQHQTILDKTLFSSLILTTFTTILLAPLMLNLLIGYKAKKLTG